MKTQSLQEETLRQEAALSSISSTHRTDRAARG